MLLSTFRAVKRKGDDEGNVDPEAATMPLEGPYNNNNACTQSSRQQSSKADFPQKRGISSIGAQCKLSICMTERMKFYAVWASSVRRHDTEGEWSGSCRSIRHHQQQLLDDTTGMPVVNADHLVHVNDVTNRIDTVPAGIILVIGDIGNIPEGTDLASPSAAAAMAGPESSTEESSEALRGRIEDVLASLQLKLQTIQRTLATEEQDKNSTFPIPVGQPLALASNVSRCIAKVEKLNHAISQDRRLGGMLLVANMGEESDGQFLSQMEVMQTLRQFLYRSVPMAAAASGSLIITNTTGVTRQLLSDGLQAASTAVDVSALLVEGIAPEDPNGNGGIAIPRAGGGKQASHTVYE